MSNISKFSVILFPISLFLFNIFVSIDAKAGDSRKFCVECNEQLVGVVGVLETAHAIPHETKLPKILFKWGDSVYQDDYGWVAPEIEDFLKQEEVASAIGLDAMSNQKEINITIERSSLVDNWGVTGRKGVRINSRIFEEKEAKDIEECYQQPLNDSELYKKSRNHYCNVMGASFGAKKLYRDLLVAHELSHVREYEIGETITGHKVTDRVETKILANLYKSGKISRELFNEVYDLLIDKQNMIGRKDERIEEVRREILG